MTMIMKVTLLKPQNKDEIMFNEYSIDDTLDNITRLEKYHASEFSLQRFVNIF
jgi:hypothetical protein